MPHLRKVSLVGCPGVNTSALAAFLAFCPLEVLELQDCCGVTQAGVRAVLAACGCAQHDLEVVYKKGGATRSMHC